MLSRSALALRLTFTISADRFYTRCGAPRAAPTSPNQFGYEGQTAVAPFESSATSRRAYSAEATFATAKAGAFTVPDSAGSDTDST